ncbi:MAG: O-methyltransferase [SAR324 cluster bacterium]|nr:O-methyltransferase [SAR324 cluster bacterium]
MTPEMQVVIDELHGRIAEEQKLRETLSREEFSAGRSERLLAIGEEAGRFLNLLVKSAGATRLLEVGTSVGYSTLWLADAARSNGGHVVTMDNNPAKHAQARDYLARAGLAGVVTLVTGDAVQAIGDQVGPFDFVLLDCDKDAYLPAFEAFHPKLAPGGIIVADNMTYPVSEHAPLYQQRVRETAGMESTFLPIGNGLEFSRRAS